MFDAEAFTFHFSTIKLLNVSTLLKSKMGLCLFLLVTFTFSSCKKEAKFTYPLYSDKPLKKEEPTTYHFAVYPLHNPILLVETYQPLMDYLNQKFGTIQFNLETSTNYSEFEIKYKKRLPEFILPNPWQTLQAIKKGYKVIAMAGEPTDFKGIIIVRKDANIVKPCDLKGKTVSYPSATALAACIMPQYYLFEHGININKDIQNSYVGSQEASIMNVYYKLSDAGATWSPPWRAFKKKYPKEAAEMRVIWETESLINNSVMVRMDIPKSISDSVQTYLIELNTTAEGKKILAKMNTTRFIKATNNDYNVVKEYMDNFEKLVRKIEENEENR